MYKQIAATVIGLGMMTTLMGVTQAFAADNGNSSGGRPAIPSQRDLEGEGFRCTQSGISMICTKDGERPYECDLTGVVCTQLKPRQPQPRFPGSDIVPSIPVKQTLIISQ
ncbi:hypothetical protein NIES2135_34570 [Leptolyngbya boryana NIES-2135]|jgi:hypothetical protein|uniref:Uncharacterized protein n=1 Tax=Leptolyngbya boryana NIES-2135 TaxID=1973484 RepID=A0A1Z4JIZ5_LEPBY|nr:MULTISPECIES: hypothetical protein [Leptolyngbya]BAY56623.1 hypothetical protein NIES2135_34570 [Leptolyngbya boryana NIES-2135]MBD2369540.1 hypothetical protein [Leptolyngbya sp. FACHB-161]MBD2377353.1 hypothetical protein [Leptolyngbya sp. FACHB-238]MBD2401762.1 hypothetical protein [Leptolyngbya sp. FACHB-239]MBD2408229.1 hypothetical protein [Leptolyngbya sp. FACHB-402]